MIVVNHTASAQGINPVYIALITGAITAVAAVFGVWLTQRKTVHLAYQQRSDARKEAVRRLVGELVTAARPWSLTLVVQSLGMSQTASQSELDDVINSETFGETRQKRQEMMGAFLEARLRIADQPLADRIDEALIQAESLSASTSKLFPSRSRPVGRDLEKAVAWMLVQQDSFEGCLREIESAASSMLREEMNLSVPTLFVVRAWREFKSRIARMGRAARRKFLRT